MRSQSLCLIFEHRVLFGQVLHIFFCLSKLFCHFIHLFLERCHFFLKLVSPFFKSTAHCFKPHWLYRLLIKFLILEFLYFCFEFLLQEIKFIFIKLILLFLLLDQSFSLINSSFTRTQTPQLIRVFFKQLSHRI